MLEMGILDWEDRFELIEGEIVPMNSQSTPHFLIKSRLVTWLGRHVEPELDVGIDGSVQIDANSMFEPDVVVLRRQKLEAGAFVQIRDALLVVEVADASLTRDIGVKARAYAAANVPELWVLDLSARVTHVHREPSPDGYKSVAKTSFDEVVAPLKVSVQALRIADLEG